MNLPKISKKTAIRVSLIISIIVISLTILAYFQPVISISFIKSENVNTESSKINLETSGEFIKLENLSFIEFEDGNTYTGESYEYDVKDFIEGKNEITVYREIDLYFVKLRSNLGIKLTVDVDRIKPELSLEGTYPEFIILDDLKLNITSEPQLEIFINEERFDNIGTGDDLKAKTVTADIIIPLENGANKFEITVIDDFGNISEPLSIKTEAFINFAYSKVGCEGFKMPLKDEHYDAGTCSNYILGEQIIFPKADSINPCSGPCGFIPDNISLGTYWTNDINEAITYFKSTEESPGPMAYLTYIYGEKEITTKNGYTAQFLDLKKYSMEDGYRYLEVYLIENNDILYVFYFSIDSSQNSTAVKEQWTDDLRVAVDNVIFE